MRDPWFVARAPDPLDERSRGRAWDPPRFGVRTAIGGATIVCALLVILGSFGHGTTRTWRIPNGFQQWEEGAARWAGWTFLYGVVALALLVAAIVLPRYLKPFAAAFAAIPFALVAYLGRKNWLRLLEERDRPRDYELHIAAGLPVVTVAAAAGLLLVLLLAILWLWQAVGGGQHHPPRH